MADALRLFTFLLYCSVCHSAVNDHLHLIVLSSNKFAVNLHSVLRKQEGLKNDNIFFSPSSLSVAFGMTFMGSRKRTKAQISKAFYWEGLDEREIHSAFKTFHEAIHSSDRNDIQLRMVNRIWGHHELEGTTEFSEGTREFYNAGMSKADFVRRPEDARVDVNEWVEKNTGGRIQDFIPPGMFGVDTRLALVNAVYFKGDWLREFNSEKTYHAPFYISDDRENMLEAEMMSQKAMWNYFLDEKDQCQILELPYVGQDLSMVVVLPDEISGLERLEDSLTAEKLQTWLGSFENTTVEVALPKFRLNQQFELSKVLPQLGIKDLFREGVADLSGISTSEDLHVSHIVHKVHVEVNEKGAEASAASGVHAMKRSLDLHPVFHADHPFLFFIYHKPTHAILFFGRVVRPTEQTRGNGVNRTEHFEENMQHSVDEL